MAHRNKGLLRAAALLTACTLIVTACGDSENDAEADTGAEETNTTPADSNDVGDGAYDPTANLEALFAGTYADPPQGSPPPAEDKNVWVISADQAIPVAATTADGVVSAGEHIDWDVTVFDAQSNPAQANDGIRQAVAAQADAIIAIYLDCSAIKAGLITADDADVTTIAIESADCDDEPLYDHTVGYNVLPDFYGSLPGEFLNLAVAWQQALVDYAVAKAGADAKVLFVSQTDVAVSAAQTEGGLEQLARCAECELVNVEITLADYGPPLQEKVQQALQQHPDVKAIVVQNDAMLATGVIGALRSADLYGEVVIAGGEGSPEMVPVMRDYPGDWAFSLLPVAWEGYAAVDALNRVFNGEEPAESSGIGLQLVDKDHNLPESGEVLTPVRDGEPIDFDAAYAAAWGAG